MEGPLTARAPPASSVSSGVGECPALLKQRKKGSSSDDVRIGDLDFATKQNGRETETHKDDFCQKRK